MRPKQSDTTLLEELRLYPDDFQNYLRMDYDIYNELLELISPLIVKQDTNFRDAITPHERLAATLRYLATGRSFEDLKFSTRISAQSLGHIIPETCRAIYETLAPQYLKDLHRTGCSNFSGDENEEDRAVLKRLLLAYARWNKRVGYCQGFNVIAALLLNVMDGKEEDALKVMIYLIDSVLPESYFANNLRALSVDMAVFRDLLRLTYPRLSTHLDRLQLAAQDIRTGACYEPPLTNVFTMQWFLTLFATCLPVSIVLRVWDSILLEGSEILLRTALTIWGKLAKRIMGASSADEFYCLMGELSSSIMQGALFDGDTMIKSIYLLGDFPFPHLNELREKYTYNIRPFTPSSTGSKKSGSRSAFKSLFNSDEDDMDDDDIAAMACMPGDVSTSCSDISVLGPGVYSSGLEEGAAKGAPHAVKGGPQLERMSTDIQSLKLQYQRLKQRQQQAHVIIAAASASKKSQASVSHRLGSPGAPASALVADIESPTAMNHLFVGKSSSSSKNCLVTDGPRISSHSHCRQNNGLLAKQLQAVANAKAVSKSKRMRTGVSSKTIVGTSSLKPSSSLDQPKDKGILDLLSDDVNAESCSEVKKEATDRAKSSSCETLMGECCGTQQLPSDAGVSLINLSSTVATGVADQTPPPPVVQDTDPKSVSTICRSAIVQTEDVAVVKLIEEDRIFTDTLTTCVPHPTDHDGHSPFYQEVENSSDTFQASASCPDQATRQDLPQSQPDSQDCLARADQTESPCQNTDIGNHASPSMDVPKPAVHHECANLSLIEVTEVEIFREMFDISDTQPSKQLELEASPELLPADSGVDSPSANSPMLSPQSALQCQSSMDESPLELEEEMILSIEKKQPHSSLHSQTMSVFESHSGSAVLSDETFDSESIKITMSSVSLYRDLTESDGLLAPTGSTSGNHHNSSSSSINTEQSSSFLTPKEGEDSKIVNSSENDRPLLSQSVGDNKDISADKHDSPSTDERKVSSSSTDSVAEVIRLLDAVRTASPTVTRSISLLETVPDPQSYDASNDVDTSVFRGPKTTEPITTCISKDVNHDENVGTSIPSVVRKMGRQTMIISHKPLSHPYPSRSLSTSAKPDTEIHSPIDSAASLKKPSRPFNPFPVKHFNANRARTGLKLGLYTSSTLDQLRGLKSRTTSS